MVADDYDADLSEYDLYVLKGLYQQEARIRGRELTQQERRHLRESYLLSSKKAGGGKSPYRRREPAEALSGEYYTWKPAVPARKIRDG